MNRDCLREFGIILRHYNAGDTLARDDETLLARVVDGHLMRMSLLAYGLSLFYKEDIRR